MLPRIHNVRIMTGWLAALCAASTLAGQTIDVSQRMARPGAEPARALLPAEDRVAIDAIVGFAPDDFTPEMQWFGLDTRSDECVSWQRFRDRLVIVQSWSSHDEAGLEHYHQAIETVRKFSPGDVHLILVHTPGDTSDLDLYLDAAESLQISIVVDPDGAWCDMHGIYRTPVNFLVDRNGAIRYAGLTTGGIERAIHILIDDPYLPRSVARPLPPFDERDFSQFPEFHNQIGRSTDLRGRKAPPLHVERWITSEPSMPPEKVRVVEFWATWCPHCITAIPHLNDLADAFRDEAVFIGLSDEGVANFDQRLAERRLSRNSFRYAIALDPTGRMKRQAGIAGIPHVLVISSDGIVRWQGHPRSLNRQLMQQIIAANAAMLAGDNRPQRGWTMSESS